MADSNSATPKGNRPQITKGLRIYAVGDIHGRADLLRSMFARIDADLALHPMSNSVEVFMGDYIDRGPASREVIDQLIARSLTHQTVFLRGNHETFLSRFTTTPSILSEWQQLGGLETLMSYGIAPSINARPDTQMRLAAALNRVLPERHRAFLAQTRLSYSCGDFFFAHAGVRPGVSLESQCEEDLLWIRGEFLNCEDDFGKVVVHGHTPVPAVDIRLNRINIDTGAYATGRLTCLVLEEDKTRFL